MGLYLVLLIAFAVGAVAAGAVFLYWVAKRKQIAAETVGRAEEQALRIHKDAERDAETRKKEALLEAKEKAHELRIEAERQGRERAQQLADLEQQLHRRESALAERTMNVDRKDKELQARAQTVGEKEKTASAAATKYEQLVAQQQHAIERLIADGRIHPARIEEVVEKVKAEMEESVRKDGEAAAFELGMHDLHPELQKLMGRLKYRTSYGQNVLNHSKEVAYLAGIMAKEVGLNATVAIRAAFLHDCGKAINRELEGTHLEIGIDLLRKHGESEAVVMAMAAHHMDIDWPSLEAMIVQAADAISAARPGARRDILESYVKRLEKLEEIADSFKGVSKAFALQAGREIRIMVESEKISDEEAVWLSKDIARRIENELEYPGHIKVTVIRETRAVEYAK